MGLAALRPVHHPALPGDRSGQGHWRAAPGGAWRCRQPHQSDARQEALRRGDRAQAVRAGAGRLAPQRQFDRAGPVPLGLEPAVPHEGPVGCERGSRHGRGQGGAGADSATVGRTRAASRQAQDAGPGAHATAGHLTALPAPRRQLC
ncbi:hypothetical protein VARIO8X_60174 [Burkholderiales bacterium 8X]|nr:hypothetical protein VARIO8X_60174 [Burkholderiales bacterium 8X]